MLEFIKNYWSEILSIVGAAAWLPIIIIPVVNHFRKMQATILDSHILTNGKGISAYKKEEKNGIILMLVLNLFVKRTTLFAQKISMNVHLKNGAVLNTELLDFSTLTVNNSNGTKSNFDVPMEQEFNVSRTIYHDVDNIKYIAILVESANFSSVDEISKIEMTIFYTSRYKKFFSKKLILSSLDFPTFNSAKLIEKVERCTNDFR